MGQADSQIRIFGIGTVLLVILIKDKILKKMKLTRILHIFKINYNLVLNRRLCVHKYYFHEGDDTIWHMSNNSKLASAPLIEKGLHELLLAGPGVHYVSQNTPANIKIWHQRLSHIDYGAISDL